MIKGIKLSYSIISIPKLVYQTFPSLSYNKLSYILNQTRASSTTTNYPLQSVLLKTIATLNFANVHPSPPHICQEWQTTNRRARERDLIYLSRDLGSILDPPSNSDPGGGRQTHKSTAEESGLESLTMFPPVSEVAGPILPAAVAVGGSSTQAGAREREGCAALRVQARGCFIL